MNLTGDLAPLPHSQIAASFRGLTELPQLLATDWPGAWAIRLFAPYLPRLLFTSSMIAALTAVSAELTGGNSNTATNLFPVLSLSCAQA